MVFIDRELLITEVGWTRFFCIFNQLDIIRERARTQSPTTTNYAPEFPSLGGIAGVSPAGVQWQGLNLGELPCWSQCPLSQVSMKKNVLDTVQTFGKLLKPPVLIKNYEESTCYCKICFFIITRFLIVLIESLELTKITF